MDTKEIPLEDWAAKNVPGIPIRTVKNWAKEKELPAKLRTVVVEVTLKRRVRKYMIPANAKPPEKFMKDSLA